MFCRVLLMVQALRRLHLAAVLHQAAADEEERKRRHALMAAAASSQHSSASSARVAAAPGPPPMSSRSVLDLLADGAAREVRRRRPVRALALIAVS